MIVPAPVITESTTGNPGHDAPVNRVLKSVTVAALDERLARAAGALRFARRRSVPGPIDAMIVACADDVSGTVIFTGDPHDLRPLAAERGRTRVIAV